MKSLSLIPLLFACLQFLPAQEGAFNIHTGEQLSEEMWKSQLPEQWNLFGSDELLEITLESDFKNFVARKYKDEYQEAFIHTALNDSVVVKRKIRIKPRGEFRKKYCSFPPIKLNFKKTEFYIEDLEKLEKMKMVTDCKSSKAFQQYILKEYLVYRIYNLFTDMSFKVRLIKVNYVDTGRKNKGRVSYSFLIEDAHAMAERQGMVQLKNERAMQRDIDPLQMTRVALFMFMIGNTDWSVPGLHNVKMIKVNEFNAPGPYVVPYDFDYSGLVDAYYAMPAEGLPITEVTERLFQGLCQNEEIYQKAAEFYLEKEKEVYRLINAFPYLEDREKKNMVSYIEDFYQILKDPKNFKFYLESGCKS